MITDRQGWTIPDDGLAGPAYADEISAVFAKLDALTSFSAAKFGALTGDISSKIQSGLDAIEDLLNTVAADPNLPIVPTIELVLPDTLLGEAHGLLVPSHTRLVVPGVLVHNDPAASALITTKTWSTTGSVSNGGATITVASTAGMRRGGYLLHQCGGTIDGLQNTTITADVGAGSGIDVPAANLTGAGADYWQLGSEIVQVDSFGSGTAHLAARGLFGTAATTHASGTAFAPLRVGRGLIASIDGNDVTLVDALDPSLPYASARALTSAPLVVGTVGSEIDVHIDGRKADGDSTNSYPIRLLYATKAKVRARVDDSPHSVLVFDNAIGCQGDVTGEDPLNSGIWFYQGSFRNRCRGEIDIRTTAKAAVIVDDRTDHSTAYDYTPIGNVIDGVFKGLHLDDGSTGASISGGCQTLVRGLYENFRTGVFLESPTQGGGATRGCSRNNVSVSVIGAYNGVQFDNTLDAVNVETTKNLVDACVLEATNAAVYNETDAIAKGNVIGDYVAA